ncbi:MAG: DNA primase catalytic subunit PriS [Candidatus Micrarchaeia archaeon]
MLEPKTMILDNVREFYKQAYDLAPIEVSHREFAVGDFENKISQRHLSFKNGSELKNFLVSNAPMHVHYSQAFYKYPDARPMERKELTGAELVFDIDITDMNLPCQKVHGKNVVCPICLGTAKEEATKLVEDFLVPDFGFSKKEIEINFSGNRGYHIHVLSSEVFKLSVEARKEITDYIAGKGLNFSEFFPTSKQRGVLLGPKLDDPGWGGRIARSFVKALENGPDALMQIGIEGRIARNLYKKRALVELGIKNGNWDMVYIKKKSDFWESIINKQVIMQSDLIDRNVTSGITHTIRLPNTIHGDTGLVAKKVAFSELNRFDPMKECIAFDKGELKIKVSKSPSIEMKGMTFGPYENAETTVPIYVGIYLYLKGFAQIVDFN